MDRLLYARHEIIKLYPRKRLEVRANRGVAAQVKTGDLISFNDRVQKRAGEIRYYATIEDVLEHEDHDQIGPEHTLEEVRTVLKKIYPLPVAEGFVVIELLEA
jgi:ASC-1-like (ASCH) protein